MRASVLKDAAEIQLATHLVVLRDKLQPYFAAGNYQEALVELAALRSGDDVLGAVVATLGATAHVSPDAAAPTNPSAPAEGQGASTAKEVGTVSPNEAPAGGKAPKPSN